MSHFRPGFLTLVLTASLLFWGSIAVTPASAALITFAFEGKVTQIGSSVIDTTKYDVGSLLKGSYAFDPFTPNVSGFPGFGVYDNAISNLHFTLGTYNSPVSTITPNVILVRDNFPNNDGYNVVSPFAGAPVNSNNPFRFSLQVNNPLNGLSNASLPTTPPGLGITEIDDNRFRVFFGDGTASYQVKGDITSLTAVPLPPAVMLFGAGLLALVGLGAGNWRQKKSTFA